MDAGPSTSSNVRVSSFAVIAETPPSPACLR